MILLKINNKTMTPSCIFANPCSTSWGFKNPSNKNTTTPRIKTIAALKVSLNNNMNIPTRTAITTMFSTVGTGNIFICHKILSFKNCPLTEEDIWNFFYKYCGLFKPNKPLVVVS